MATILLVGADGQLGWALRPRLAQLGNVEACARSSLDLGDAAAIRATVRRIKPSLIVNAAAYAAVDRAETDEAAAMLINAVAPGVLASEADAIGAWMMHFSTDYVFDGTKLGTYVESDATNPLNAYGRSKLAGENEVVAATSRHLVLRTSWLYSNHGHNFLQTMLRLGNERSEVSVVADQYGTPNWVGAVVNAVARIAASVLGGADPDVAGIYHLSCRGRANWFEFAQAIFDAYPRARRPRLVPIASEEHATPAPRPLNAVLGCDKLERVFGIEMPAWRNALLDCAAESDGAGTSK